jgi:branched-chain amino acid transport system ATP-binding protein
LRDQPITGLKAHKIIQLGMARTFQNINLFSEQTTLDNILIGAHRHLGNPFADMLGFPSSRRNEAKLRDKAVELAESLHLQNELDNLVKNLPYGLQKRVELARALAAEPDIILLDEPVAGCNDEETSELMEIIRQVNEDFGITIFLVEHDMSMVMTVCDYIHVINFGANLAEGTPKDIQANRDVINAYLGEDH